jgi:hypothetical protein
MKHFVNLSLLFFFLTLVTSGLMRFLLPFDLVTTRLHMVFGIGTLLLVGFHLASRGRYFASLLRKPRQPGNGSGKPVFLLSSVLICWGYLVAAALWNLPPVDLLVSASYEARHTKEIFRDNARTAFEPIESGMQVKRVTDKAASIRLELDWGEAFKPAVVQGQPLGTGYPQIAIWAETEDGTILETLYVSQACAASHEFAWNGIPQSRDQVLPVWYSRYKKILGREPDEDVDAVSSATPVRDFSMEGYLTMDAQPFSVFVEINAPGDPNEHFHHNQPDSSDGYVPQGIGQPSVVYETFVFAEDQRRYFLLDLTSHSGGQSGKGADNITLNYELEHLTTAKQIIEKILLQVNWPDSTTL